MKNRYKPGIIVLLLLILSISIYAQESFLIPKDQVNLQVKQVIFEQDSCPCSISTYEFIVKNTGSFPEQYSFSTDSFKKYATFSENPIVLAPNQSKRVNLYINPVCNIVDNYIIFISVKTDTSKIQADIPIYLRISQCYDYEIVPGAVIYTNITSAEQITPFEGTYELCEGEKDSIPITIKNTADIDNTYKIDLKGKSWAKLESNRLAIPKNSENVTTIKLNIPTRSKGNYNVSLRVTGETATVVKNIDLPITVDICYNPSIASKGKRIKVNYSEISTKVPIINKGNKKAEYQISLEAPDWISVSPTSLSVDSKETATFNLITNPTTNVAEGTYDITVHATAQNTIDYAQKLQIVLKKPSLLVRLSRFISANLSYGIYIIIGLIILFVIIRFLPKEKFKFPQLPKRIKPRKEKKVKEAKKPEKVIKKEKIKGERSPLEKIR